MRFCLTVVIGAGIVATAGVARADEAAGGPAVSLLSAGAIEVAGFVVGGVLVSRAQGDHFRDDAGWLTIESSFVLAPVAAHGVAGEWGRGALFAVVPACALAVTAALFEMRPGTVESGTLPEQRWMWSMFGVGLFSSAVGVVDSLFAPSRAQDGTSPSSAGRRHVSGFAGAWSKSEGLNLVLKPSIGWGRAGLELGGTL